ncbi:MAG: TolC family protein [Crocinitomicaceae bacterium]|nr:TolC family protein [Crocinitomicaceae bacterium]|tara:strand:+ start:4360 stop:5688 length:1329 start_codon:yes stop_codon:yes gene_type:complete
MNLKISSLLVFIGLSSIGFAQRDLSASEAVFISLEKNYQVIISGKQHSINELNNRWSEAGAFPTVDLTLINGNTIQDNTNNPFTFIPGIVLTQSINPSLTANWNIFTGFAVRISKERLEILENQSANNAMAVIENTIQDVLKAYYTAQLQHDRKDLFKSIMELSKDKMHYYELKEKYSNANTLELMQFKNQYFTDSTNLLMQEISYDNSIRNLLLLMNDSTITAEGLNLTDKMDIKVMDVDFSEAETEMYSNNQNLTNQYISLELQKTNTAFQRSFLYPTLSFQAGVQPGWSWIREIQNNAFQAETSNLSYYGNINLRYSIFNNWKNKRAVEVSKIQEEISTLNIENMKMTLSSTLQNLIALCKARVQLVSISQENLVYSKKALELAQERFAIGGINSIDLASFLNNYQNTLIQHYENLFNKMDTYLEIYKMTGKIGLEYVK